MKRYYCCLCYKNKQFRLLPTDIPYARLYVSYSGDKEMILSNRKLNIQEGSELFIYTPYIIPVNPAIKYIKFPGINDILKDCWLVSFVKEDDYEYCIFKYKQSQSFNVTQKSVTFDLEKYQ